MSGCPSYQDPFAGMLNMPARVRLFSLSLTYPQSSRAAQAIPDVNSGPQDIWRGMQRYSLSFCDPCPRHRWAACCCSTHQ